MKQRQEEHLELKERLDRLAGAVDLEGVWASVEKRADQTEIGGSEPPWWNRKTSGARRQHAKRLRALVYAGITMVVAASVAVGTIVGIDRGQAVFGVDDGQDGYWEKLPVTAEVDGPLWLTIDPEDSSCLYATTEDGVFRSVDKAASWQRVLSYGKSYFYGLTLDPGSPSTVYVTMRVISPAISEPAVRMWRSDDRGDTWVELTAGYMDAVRAQYPERVDEFWSSCGFRRLDTSTDPTTLYLEISLTDPTGGDGSTYWRSTDRGVSWTELQGEARDQFIYGLTFDPPAEEPSYQLQSELLTDEDGRSLGSARAAKVDPSDPSTMYAVTDEGLCKSTDGGKTWARSANGMTHDVTGSLVVDPMSPSILYSVASEGVYKSDDAGDTWKKIVSAGSVYTDPDYRTCSFVIAPSAPSTLYVLTSEGLMRSEDGGQDWETRAGKGLLDKDPLNDSQGLLLVSPEDPDMVFADIYEDLSPALYRSVDGGDTWAKVLDEYFWESLVADPSDASRLYAITGAEEPSTKRVVRSVDYGATWQTVTYSDPGVARFGIAVGEGDPSTIFSWSMLDNRDGNGYGSEPSDGTDFAVSLSRSLDGGDNWEVVQFEGLPGPVVKMVADRRSPGVWHALSAQWDEAVFEAGIFRSEDGGQTWTPIYGEAPRGIYELVIGSAADGPLYASGYLGLYRWVSAGP